MPDRDTKIRQALLLPIVLISLALTLALYFDSTDWLVPAIASYMAIALLLFRGNEKIYLVPYEKSKDAADR